MWQGGGKTYLIPSEEEQARAVQCIIENVSQVTLLQFYIEILKDPEWLTLHHFGIGIEIRNLLCFNGFSWDDITLDHEWEPITLAAIRTISENAP